MPKPAFPTVARDDHFIQMRFVSRTWPVLHDAIDKMVVQAVYPLPNGCTADHNIAFSEKIFVIGGAEGKAMVDSDGLGNDLPWETQARQMRHFGRYFPA